jgi:minor extracellular serine protease Vpr
MKGKFSLVTFLMMLALTMQASIGLLRSAKAQVRSDGVKERAPRSAGPFAVIVELESEPVAVHQRLSERIPRRGVDFETSSARAYELELDSEHADFKSRAALVSPNLRVRAELHRLANAVSIEATPEEVAAIAAIPGVKRVEVVKECYATTNASVPLINSSSIWNRLGGPSNAGQGMRIAILDTGIDITNPLFSDAGYAAPAGFPRSNNASESLTNNKVIVAKSFLSSSAKTALDENGHGTNVAGIAAGNLGSPSPLGALSGVAPRAYLGNYRVLGASGGGSTDLIARGIDEAVADHFDVINMSLGTDAPPSGAGFIEDVVQRAVDAGVVVVISAGNTDSSEAGEPMTIRSPGIAPAAITVGASSNSHITGPVITVDQPAPIDPSLIKIGSSNGNAVTLDESLKSLPYVYVDPDRRACGGGQVGSLAGKVALIERGGTLPNGQACGFTDKVNAADAAGAKAVIIFNKDISEGSDGGETIINMSVAGTRIPSVFVARSAGLALRDFAAVNPSATLSVAPIGDRSVQSDVLASFSALGPSVIEGLKPDVSAPGINIYSGAIKTGDSSAGVVNPSGFTSEQGTSQAAPHVAGAAALVKQLNPSFSPEQIKSVLISSATTDVFTAVDKLTRVGVLATGGGRVDLARASSVSATFSPASLAFGIMKLKKRDVAASIDLKITSIVDGQNNFTISVQQLDAGAGVGVTPSTGAFTLSRGQTGTVIITIAAILGSQRRDYTGYVLVSGAGQTLHVPYWIKFVKKKV